MLGNAFQSIKRKQLAKKECWWIIAMANAAPVMPTYVYQTLPPHPEIPPRRFEFRQTMREAALTHDPETGYPVRRVPQASFYLGGIKKVMAAPSAGHGEGCCGPGGGACQH